jgi:hypothetical protein
MEKDTLLYDSVEYRPLPKWLTDQRDGLNTYQPERIEMKEDRSLPVSFTVTVLIVLLTIIFLTISILRKNKKS